MNETQNKITAETEALRKDWYVRISKAIDKLDITVDDLGKETGQIREALKEYSDKGIEKLEHESLSIAKQKLLESYYEFTIYFQENPEATTKNIVFGYLNKFEWDLFQTKHLNHHFEQFGLL